MISFGSSNNYNSTQFWHFSYTWTESLWTLLPDSWKQYYGSRNEFSLCYRESRRRVTIKARTFMKPGVRISSSRLEMIPNSFQSSKLLAEKQSILRRIVPTSSGKWIPDATVVAVKECFEDMRLVVRPTTYKTVKAYGVFEPKGKRLILFNTFKASHLFQQGPTELKIQFSKFFMLHPKWVVIVDDSRVIDGTATKINYVLKDIIINTARLLLEWADSNILNIKFIYTYSKTYERKRK